MMSLSLQRIERLAHELTARSDQAVLEAIKRYDVETKVAIRHAIGMQREAQGLQAQADEPSGRRPFEPDGAYWLRRLHSHGPIDLKALDVKLSVAGLEPRVRMEIKTEAVQRGWLAGGLGYRIDGPEDVAAPLAVAMRALYHRAGLEEDHLYTEAEVNERLQHPELDTEQRIALRGELALHHQICAAGDHTGDDRLTAKITALGQQLAALRRLQHQRS
jgi:hypothetical protein